ncbi:MAG: hypothetical protein U0694_10605 [Anaerolineae bacterium]
MGIKLEWEIESGVRNTGEDPEAARQRRRLRMRLLFGIGFFVVAVLSCFGLVALRLRYVDDEVRQQLVNTVDAEVAALRIGDWNAFLNFQHYCNPEWAGTQRQQFNAYQALKLEQNIQLPGHVLSVTLDDQQRRARVVVEEIVDGVSYSRVWFYYLFPETRTQCDDPQTTVTVPRWLHVAPDYTFWGSQQTFTADNLTIVYYDVDTALVEQMGPRLTSWINSACAALPCDNSLPLAVVVLPNPTLQIGWMADNPLALQMPSPYTTRARTDQPFDPELQLQIANMVADHFVALASNSMQPVYPADAYYLRQAVVSWLVGQFVEIDTSSFVISSLAAQYGAPAVGRLVQAMQPTSDARVLAQAAGVASLDGANLDWRDFLTWRLIAEDSLIAQRDEANFLALYDTRDENIRNAALARFNAASPAENRVVTVVGAQTGADGSPELTATVQVGEGDSARQELVLFRLVDGLWKRAS